MEKINTGLDKAITEELNQRISIMAKAKTEKAKKKMESVKPEKARKEK